MNCLGFKLSQHVELWLNSAWQTSIHWHLPSYTDVGFLKKKKLLIVVLCSHFDWYSDVRQYCPNHKKKRLLQILVWPFTQMQFRRVCLVLSVDGCRMWSCDSWTDTGCECDPNSSLCSVTYFFWAMWRLIFKKNNMGWINLASWYIWTIHRPDDVARIFGEIYGT